MRRLVSTLASLLFCAGLLCARMSGADSLRTALLDSMLSNYLSALDDESLDVKMSEADTLINAVDDSLLRQRVALKVYNHFLESKLMGDEAVAIHVYDNWFATQLVKMPSELDRLNAKVFADFNRASLLGCTARPLTLLSDTGESVDVPRHARTTVLFFYDISCPNCLAQSILMRTVAEHCPIDMDLCAVYTGQDEEGWAEYRDAHFSFSDSCRVHVMNLWDPDLQSDFGRSYGVLQTPRMFLVDQKGEIIGRGLDCEALQRLLPYAGILQELYSRCPEGSPLPDITVPGVLVRRGRQKAGQWNLARQKKCVVVFRSSSCAICRELVDSLLERREKLLLVDSDEALRQSAAAGVELLDMFDLTQLPFALRLDRKGRVSGKYLKVLPEDDALDPSGH